MKVQPFTLLLGRVALGVVFAAHGWQKFSGTGLDDVEAAFERMHHGDVLRSVVIL